MRLPHFLAPVVLVLAASCAVRPAASTTAPAAVPPSAVAAPVAPPPSGMRFEERQFDWSTATVVHASIRRTSFAVAQPRLMKGSCARVNLSDPDLRFLVSGRAPEWGQPMPDCTNRHFQIRTRRQTAREFMLEARRPVAAGGRGLNLLLAVNSSPWSPFEPPWNHKYADETGLIVSDGVLVAPPIGYPSFLVYQDGSVEFRNVSPKEDLGRIRQAVSGFGMVLTNGLICGKNDPKSLAPRTGFGLSRDKHYLYLFVVDGRQPDYSMGANTYEVGEWLRYFGSDSGMNMDGGGSTTLFCWDPVADPANTDPKSQATPQLHKLNHQGWNAERSLACTLGIYFVDGR